MYFLPFENTVGADFWIYKGWENSCKNLKIDFKLLLSKDSFYDSVNIYNPDILFIQHKFGFRGKNLEQKIKALSHFKKKKIKVFLAVDWFESGPELTTESDLNIFRNEDIAHIYFGEREEDSMIEFENSAKQKYYKIPNSADKNFHFPTQVYEKYKYDIVFLGAKLPKKKYFFEEILIPLKEKYNVGIFGPYWTIQDNIKRISAKIARNFGLDKINEIINDSRVSIKYEDENKLYSSSKICLNYHEKENEDVKNNQKNINTYHKILNQRAFKIPACGGFQLIDNLDYINKYFESDELISCNDPKDWFKKIDYYIRDDEARLKILKKSIKRAHKDHMYENRIKLILKLANKI